jgi:hypothetical protein
MSCRSFNKKHEITLLPATKGATGLALSQKAGESYACRRSHLACAARGGNWASIQDIHYKHFNKAISKRRGAFSRTKVADRSKSLLTFSIVSNYPLMHRHLPASRKILKSKNDCRI